MLSGYTFFTTYMLTSVSGYSNAIHCNYINSIVLNTTNPLIQNVILRFPSISDFKFLSSGITTGVGYVADKLYAIFQLVQNSGFTTMNDIQPDPSQWRILGLITGSTSAITATQLTNQTFSIPLNKYYNYGIYNLHNYMPQYPTKNISDDDKLCFGDETFFLGNVSTQIKAVAYTTDIAILLDFNQFNSSTNETWNSSLDTGVTISEVGIYDANMNLVAIGKLNNPIKKDSSIARTIVFAIDF